MLTSGIQLDGLRRIHHQYAVWCYVEGRIPAVFDNMGPLGTAYHELDWVLQQKWASRTRRDPEKILEHMCVLAWAGNNIGGIVEHIGSK